MEPTESALWFEAATKHVTAIEPLPGSKMLASNSRGFPDERAILPLLREVVFEPNNQAPGSLSLVSKVTCESSPLEAL